MADKVRIGLAVVLVVIVAVMIAYGLSDPGEWFEQGTQSELNQGE
jgi:hypothetical protein